ncbi:MAG: hypothetical protein H0Z24_06715 [Thermosipho sp. (in: Bacteria)]|nr:hypothetical protein [Thermosipho sp. (in: thermotogales)]
MRKEVKELAYRAIIRYLNGDTETARKLVFLAEKLDKQETCRNCGKPIIKAMYFRKKNVWVNGKFCTSCGQFIDNKGKIIKRGFKRGTDVWERKNKLN